MKTKEEKTFELLEVTNTNWSVAKIPLVSVNGTPTQSFGIFRKDPIEPKWLGTVGTQYVPMQNSELAMTLIEAGEAVGIDVARGGQLKDGARIYYQAELPSTYIGKSDVKRYITALNAHDGTKSIGFGSSNTVVICQNTFNMAYGDVNHFRHTASAKERLRNAILDMELTIKKDDALMEKFKLMDATTIKDEAIERVMRKIFKAELNDDQSKVSTRKKNQIEQFAGALDRELKDEGRTLWGLFNGVTRYTNHVMSTKDKDSSLMTGAGYQMANMAFDEIMAYIEENTAELVTV